MSVWSLLIEMLVSEAGKLEKASKDHSEQATQLSQALNTAQINMHRIEGAYQAYKAVSSWVNDNADSRIEHVADAQVVADVAPAEVVTAEVAASE